MSSQPPAEDRDIAILADVILRKPDLEAFGADLEAFGADLEAFGAAMQAHLTRMERRLIRAYYLVPVGLVLGVSFVPLIAERLFS